jgi:hypothetical protein
MPARRDWQSVDVVVKTPKPQQKIGRLIGQRAHVRDTDVEQMRRVAGRVSDPPPEPSVLFDQMNRQRGFGLPQQVYRQKGAGEASPNDGDPGSDAIWSQSRSGLCRRGRIATIDRVPWLHESRPNPVS